MQPKVYVMACQNSRMFQVVKFNANFGAIEISELTLNYFKEFQKYLKFMIHIHEFHATQENFQIQNG